MPDSSSIARLKAGLHQFLHTVHASERELFEQLASGQNPYALFITCSDSRISPSLITQSKPGDLFVLRNVANIVPPYSDDLDGEAAAVEYAVHVLEVRDVIVCGHLGCGGIGAVLDPSQANELPAVRQWISHAEQVRRIVDEHLPDADREQRLQAAVEINVLIQLSNLRTHPTVAAALAAGQVNLHGWVYDIGNGLVSAFDCSTDTFVPLIREG